MDEDQFHHMTLGELLNLRVETYPDHPYLTLGDDVWTYSRAARVAGSLAGALRELGFQPGDRLALLLPNVPAFVLTVFAAAKAGLVTVPINIRRHQHEVALRLANTCPRGVVTFSSPESFWGVDHLEMVTELQSEIPGMEFVIALQGDEGDVIAWESLALSENSIPAPTAHPQDPAAVVHTLGSSGQPRGAMLSHQSLVRNAAAIAGRLECTPDDVFLGGVPFSNAFGLTPTILACMVAGAQLACLPRYSPGKALRLIEGARVTVHHGVPTMFAMELNHPDFNPEACKSLRTGIMSGAPCPPDLVKRLHQEMGCKVLLAYGLTETSPSVTMTRLEDGPVTSTETVGRPHDGVSLKVIDEKGRELPPGEEGELCVRGYNVMLGYWEDPEASARVLDSEGWLHTGDLGVIDPDGPVRVVGRKDDVINRGGFKIYPATVEMVLRAYPGVKDAAVISVPDLIYGELSYACIVPQPEADLSAEDLLSYAADHLAGYAIPDRVLFFESLPRHGSGPVERGYLRRRVRIRGRAWRFGANVDTDAIIPARRCNTADPRELALYCMEDADPEFVRKMHRGDLIVADTNFGCGSSREVAPLSIKAAGVSAVIAKSFARIFFRNAINIGLPILECPEAVDRIQEGDEIEVEPATGTILNLTRSENYQAVPFPDFLQRIIDRGGLLAYVEDRIAQEAKGENS